MSRWIEFFEGTENRLSMSRLLCFGAFFPASYVVIATLSDEALGWYLGTFVLGYVGGKASDAFKRTKE
jgi:hypothetical protein